MQDANKPAVLGLPNEVLMRIFSQLNKRSDVAACRLACRSFKETSSPFLITRVVIAKRLDTMSKFYDVMEHPFFRKHVTELIYDASWYDRVLATDPMAYADARHDEARIERMPEVKAQNQQYAQLVDRALRDVPDTDRPKDLLKHMLDNSDFSCKMVTYHDYNMRFGYQFRMQSTDMHVFALRSAFDNFPRLRQITFGDYRNAARGEETHAECCERLFGDTLQPYALNVDLHAADLVALEEDQPEPWLELARLVAVLQNLPQNVRSRIRTFQIGSHPYVQLPSRPDHSYEGMIQGNAGVPLDFGEDQDVTLGELEGFKGIQHLALPVETAGPMLGQRLVLPLIQHAAPTLVHLELSTENLLPSLMDDAEDNVIDKLLFALDFPALRHLELRGWLLHPVPMINFLSKIATTLKELRLIGNVVYDPVELARWGGENLALDGVQLRNYDRGAGVAIEDDITGSSLSSSLEEQWLAGRRNFLSKVPVVVHEGEIDSDEEDEPLVSF